MLFLILDFHVDLELLHEFKPSWYGLQELPLVVRKQVSLCLKLSLQFLISLSDHLDVQELIDEDSEVVLFMDHEQSINHLKVALIDWVLLAEEVGPHLYHLLEVVVQILDILIAKQSLVLVNMGLSWFEDVSWVFATDHLCLLALASFHLGHISHVLSLRPFDLWLGGYFFLDDLGDDTLLEFLLIFT